MRAFYLHGARDLRDEQVDVPTFGADQVLVRLGAAGICGTDMHYYHHGSNAGFDIVIEASGAASALRSAYERCNAGGVIVQLGNQLGDVPVPANLALVKELTIRGSFRFAHQFGRALDLLARGRLNVQPLITNTHPLSALPEALDTALDAESVKVVLEQESYIGMPAASLCLTADRIRQATECPPIRPTVNQ